jgi:hypothetical protein
LLEHLVKVVIPLANTKPDPKEPPVGIPTRSNQKYKLGAKSEALIELDNSTLSEKEQIHLDAMKDRDRKESEGFGDQLMEMQETSWPLERIRKGYFKIDMCFDYKDNGESMLQWCQGTVVKVLKDKADTDK